MSKVASISKSNCYEVSRRGRRRVLSWQIDRLQAYACCANAPAEESIVCGSDFETLLGSVHRVQVGDVGPLYDTHLYDSLQTGDFLNTTRLDIYTTIYTRCSIGLRDNLE